jgi:hypothetical protein
LFLLLVTLRIKVYETYQFGATAENDGT